jgi:hypothetical protein
MAGFVEAAEKKRCRYNCFFKVRGSPPDPA